MTKVRFRYQTIEIGKHDIHLRTLRDKQQFNDDEGIAEDAGINSSVWPLFGVVWPSSIVLANFLVDYDIENLRILEIGCGIGISSIMLNQRDANISSTDYHHEAGNFLELNTNLNNDKDIPFYLADWADNNKELGKFDLIIGSDLLYEDEHVAMLSEFIEQHANDKCCVILVDPSRGRKTKFSKKMAKYGYSYSHEKPAKNDNLDPDYKGFILSFTR